MVDHLILTEINNPRNTDSTSLFITPPKELQIKEYKSLRYPEAI